MAKSIKKLSVNKYSTVFSRKTKEGKYIIFGITHGNKPKVIGRTIPSTKEDLKKFGFITSKEYRKMK